METRAVFRWTIASTDHEIKTMATCFDSSIGWRRRRRRCGVAGAQPAAFPWTWQRCRRPRRVRAEQSARQRPLAGHLPLGSVARRVAPPPPPPSSSSPSSSSSSLALRGVSWRLSLRSCAGRLRPHVFAAWSDNASRRRHVATFPCRSRPLSCRRRRRRRRVIGCCPWCRCVCVCVPVECVCVYQCVSVYQWCVCVCVCVGLGWRPAIGLAAAAETHGGAAVALAPPASVATNNETKRDEPTHETRPDAGHRRRRRRRPAASAPQRRPDPPSTLGESIDGQNTHTHTKRCISDTSVVTETTDRHWTLLTGSRNHYRSSGFYSL